MAFSYVDFSGPLVADQRSFTFASASPTKAFILYTGWTGPGNTGTRKLFIQAVYFNGRNAPTFGPACAVYNLTYASGVLQPSMCVLSDGRLLVSLLDTATSFSYYVFDVDGSDRISYSFKSGSPTQTGIAGAAYLAPSIVAIADGKAISSHPGNNGSGSYSNLFNLITVGANSFTVSVIDAGLAPCRAQADGSQNPKGWVNISATLFRKDRNGKVMALRSMWGSTYSVSSQSYAPVGYGFTSFDDQGVVQHSAGDSGLVNQNLPGAHDAGGMQKARDMLPVSSSVILSLGACDTSGNGTAQNGSTGRPNFSKITMNGIQTSANSISNITSTPEQSWRDTSPVMFQDVIWLDNEYFFALARAAASTSDDSQNGYAWTPAAADQRDCKVYIGKYNDATGSITIADAAPLPLPTRISKMYCNPMLHRISNTEVAILQVCQVEDTGTGIAEINITVCGA